MGIRRGQKFEVMSTHCAVLHSPVVVVYTGERRAPKKGEFFISGAVPTAYKAENDMSAVHCIAVRERDYVEVVKGETKIDELELKLMSVITAHAQQNKGLTQTDTVELLESMKKKIEKI